MVVTVIFLIAILAHFTLSIIHYRAGFFLFMLLYGIYPRFFSLGLSNEGFALTGQRAMILVLFGLFILRVLWGSAEVRLALNLLKQYRMLMLYLSLFLLSRLAGNLVTGRIDVGSIGAMVSEVMLSAFVVILVITYVRTRADISTLMGAIMI